VRHTPLTTASRPRPPRPGRRDHGGEVGTTTKYSARRSRRRFPLRHLATAGRSVNFTHTHRQTDHPPSNAGKHHGQLVRRRPNAPSTSTRRHVARAERQFQADLALRGNNNYNGNSQNPGRANRASSSTRQPAFVTGARSPLEPPSLCRRTPPTRPLLRRRRRRRGAGARPASPTAVRLVSITDCGARRGQNPTTGRRRRCESNSNTASRTALNQAQSSPPDTVDSTRGRSSQGTREPERERITSRVVRAYLYSEIYRQVPLPTAPAGRHLRPQLVQCQKLPLDANAPVRATVTV